MPASPVDPAGDLKSPASRTRNQQSLPRRTYRFRILGMGLSSLPIIVVMLELQSGWISWAWMALSCLLWPHLAFLLATRSRDPFRAELRNFVVDSLIAGSWVPLLHFNALPSAILLTVATADKINSGIRRLWLHALPGMLVALVAAAVLTGFAFQPATSMPVLLACLPILIIHTLAVSASSYRLVRKVQAQNLKLAELSRIDALTGLDSRAHWQDQAETLRRRCDDGGGSASVMLIDVDRFKACNDVYGHAAGDDVLRGIAGLIRRHMPADSHAGRLGGDEFAVVMPVALPAALLAAEQVRAAVESLDFPNAPGLRCTVSIGVAEQQGSDGELRAWVERADRALYTSKHAGRNQATA